MLSSSSAQAVKRLDAMLASSAAAGTRSSEASAAAGAALLRRLDDESNAVVQAALSCDSLIQLPPIAVFEGLASCFHRAIQQVLSGGPRLLRSDL